ncbi:hypothetical protein MICAE_1580025 [Microcystis aeruginosa PCC 9806]|uniref:Uncharacterized protein n=1 Tax=Microcystis aeruginosa PCC 9806 TaxID=1160282 RepID=I4GT64_MICAE|nr:hypothetical protein MICAE_1580025 [Microcystis aeruginosa PCC 9806]
MITFAYEIVKCLSDKTFSATLTEETISIDLVSKQKPEQPNQGKPISKAIDNSLILSAVGLLSRHFKCYQSIRIFTNCQGYLK